MLWFLANNNFVFEKKYGSMEKSGRAVIWDDVIVTKFVFRG